MGRQRNAGPGTREGPLCRRRRRRALLALMIGWVKGITPYASADPHQNQGDGQQSQLGSWAVGQLGKGKLTNSELGDEFGPRSVIPLPVVWGECGECVYAGG